MMRNRAGAAAASVALLALLGAAVAAAAPPPSARDLRKIDARLLSQSIARPQEVVTAWVEFADKGERSAAELTDMLAQAERALSPRSRARRLKAGVTPLVDASDLPVSAAYLETLRAQGIEPFAVSRWFNRAAVRVPAARLESLASLGFVARLAPVSRAVVIRDPAGSDPTKQGLDVLRAPLPRTTAINYGNSADEIEQLNLAAVHDSGYIGQGVVVCMLDDGYSFADQHEATQVIDVPPGFRRDFVDGDTVVTDGSAGAHGLLTLSCAGANKPGRLMGTGYGATYALARTEVNGSETPVEMLYWGLGAEWADSLGADIISSSLGYHDFDPSGPGGADYGYADMNGHTTDVTRAAEIAAAKGILVVNSAGNEGATAWYVIIAPADANGDSVIAIGAVTSDGTRSSFSSHGPTSDGRIKPDLCARGSSVSVVLYNNATGYTTASGTSFACPLAAGVCACLMSARPSWRPTTVIKALKLSASRAATPDNDYGYGVINAWGALQVPASVLGIPSNPGDPTGVTLLGPNPIRRGGDLTRILVQLGAGAPAATDASIRIVDIAGRRVRTLWSGAISQGGRVETSWDSRDAQGRPVEPGVYWVMLAAGSRTTAARLVVL